MTRIRRIKPEGKWASLLDYLQLECLPADEPCDYRPSDLWWVAFDGDAPVGFAAIRPTRAQANVWYLCRAGVVPSARGQGLQKRLIAARLRAAQAAGASMAVTDTHISNSASSNSLIAAGFRQYVPAYRWALPDSIYWRKALCPRS